MSSHLTPGDHAFHNDKQLIADLAALNEQLSRYVLRMLDADADRVQPVNVAEERRFAASLRAMADRLQTRADLRADSDTPPMPEGDATLRRLTHDRPSDR
jgi:hypothetical protein